MYAFPQYQLAVLTKTPELGKAKTRMQPALSMDFSLLLHTHLVDYVLQVWSKAKVCSLQLFLAGEDSYFFNAFPQWGGLALRSQASGDLGDRLCSIVGSTLKQYQAVILVGTDCPFIDAATDGGYVLLGLKKNAEALFSDIEWGSDSVFVETVKRIKEQGFSYFVLPELDDIDYPEDLIKLASISDFGDLLKDNI